MHAPTGFDAYCRILHRPTTGSVSSPSLRWTEIASRTGATVHPGVQWHRLIGVHESEGIPAIYADWHGHSPSHGQLSASEFTALVGILVNHSNEPDDATVGFWEGYFGSSSHEPARPNDAELDALRIRIGTRNYIAVHCNVGDYARLVQASDNAVHKQLPNVLWPSDHSWFVSSDIDLDSTIVGGTNALIRDIIDDPTLEAFPADPDLDLSTSGDVVNGVPKNSSPD